MMLNSDLPRINVSGNLGASAKSRPPKPHPMSAISTFFEMALAFRCSSMLMSCDSFCSSSVSFFGCLAYMGYRLAQSMSAGLVGLHFVNVVCYNTSELGLLCERMI
jgi:hypothetical protein